MEKSCFYSKRFSSLLFHASLLTGGSTQHHNILHTDSQHCHRWSDNRVAEKILYFIILLYNIDFFISPNLSFLSRFFFSRFYLIYLDFIFDIVSVSVSLWSHNKQFPPSFPPGSRKWYRFWLNKFLAHPVLQARYHGTKNRTKNILYGSKELYFSVEQTWTDFISMFGNGWLESLILKDELIAISHKLDMIKVEGTNYLDFLRWGCYIHHSFKYVLLKRISLV